MRSLVSSGIYSVLFFLLVQTGFVYGSVSQKTCDLGGTVRPEWGRLACRLVTDGIPEGQVIRIFSNPRLSFDPRVMPKKLSHNEYNLYYDRFLKVDRISRARAFLHRHRQLLQEVEDAYGVPKEIMVAILLVETDLGRYLGAGPAVRILASMAISDDMDLVRKWIPKEIQDSPRIRRKMRKKAEWAYNELRELIVYCQRNRLDIMSVKGSIFGAIGICQFMPSNANRLGVDFDGDGRVDLFTLPDALASMANYLRHHGWRPPLDRRAKHKVILAYNHSRPYADTILKVAERLKEGEGSRAA